MSYVPIISPSDLNNIYPNIRDEITRGDDTIAIEAIDAAIQEVRMFLTRYDLAKMFGDKGTGISAEFSDVYLTRLVKDVAAWNLFRNANVSIDTTTYKEAYDTAIDRLKLIQAGRANPEWPYADYTDTETPPSISVKVHAEKKRTNGY